jgi:squalene-hopene/tetraprenyl-beta-curcumene cyclase
MPESPVAVLAPGKLDAALASRVDGALDVAVRSILSRQHQDGWWAGEDEANPTLDAEYIFFFHYVGLNDRPKYKDKMRRLANRIRGQQLADGTWAITWGGPSDFSCTVESYFALKLAGDSPDAPHMKKAREFVQSKGGAVLSRNLTRIQLALLGQIDWRYVPALPVQLMFAPHSSRFNIYELSYWARVCTVPLAILRDYRRTCWIPPEKGISELVLPGAMTAAELAAREKADLLSWRNFFIQSDRLLKWADKLGILPLRKKALQRAEKWIRRHQDPSGDWGGIFPAMVNSLMALHVRGMDVTDPVFHKGLEALERFEVPETTERGEELHIAPCVSPVWDTAWSTVALAEAGLGHENEQIRRATAWLASMQIRRKGDWKVKCPGLEPGGWAFQFYNDRFPDTDDSSVVLMALSTGLVEAGEKRREVFDRGIRWLLGLQNSDGGWGAFERDVDDEIYNETVYSDEKNMLDPSTSDVTGRVLEFLGYCGTRMDDPVVVRALAFIRREQEPDGKWWGRWGVNYIYGTWSVLRGLAALHFSPEDPMIARAGAWIETVQNEDGGWGESCTGYLDSPQGGPVTTPRPYAKIASTASQTAWGVLGLIAAGRARSTSTRRGVEWLIAHQRSTEKPYGKACPDLNPGLWLEREFTGTGFPNAFYLRYHMYPIYFPVLALAAYRNALAGDRGSLDRARGD